MDHWTIIEWLLLQFGVLAAAGLLIVGILLRFSKARIQRLQSEFKRLAVTIGEAIAKASSEGGVQFESLLLQTKAHLESQGVGASWEDLDPAQYPEHIPLFLRSAVLELERELQGQRSDEDYWTRLSAAYEAILFQFDKAEQRASKGAANAQQKLEEVQEQSDSLQSRVKELENQLQEAKNALLQVPMELDSPNPLREPEPEGSLYSDYERVLSSREKGDTGEDASAHQVSILSNIIDDQKLRIKSLQKELTDLRVAPPEQQETAPRAVKHKTMESTVSRLEEQNQTLLEDMSALEATLKHKDQELEQILNQVDQNPVTQESEVAIRRAIVEAWRHSENSLADLEEAILKSQMNT